MTKQQIIEKIRCLLTNDYGDHGSSGIGDYVIRLPESAIRSGNIDRSWNGVHVYEVFLSDTPCGIAVSNYKCQTVDCMKLSFKVLSLIHRVLLEIRSPYNE